MSFFYKRRRIRSKSKSIAKTQKQFIQGLILLICLSLIIVFIFGDHGLLKLYKIKNQRKKIQTHIAQLRNEREQAKEKKNKRVIIAYIIGVIVTILLVSTCSWKVL